MLTDFQVIIYNEDLILYSPLVFVGLRKSTCFGTQNLDEA